nr:Chain A, DRP3 [synthetic construct]
GCPPCASGCSPETGEFCWREDDCPPC